MNEQLQAQIQEYLSSGKSPAWIANKIYFDNSDVDPYEVKSYANNLFEESKKKDSEELGEQAIESITSLTSDEELDYL